MSEEDALKVLHQEAGTHFDPRLLAHFLRRLPEIRKIIAEHPDGSRKPSPEAKTPPKDPPWASFHLPPASPTFTAGQMY